LSYIKAKQEREKNMDIKEANAIMLSLLDLGICFIAFNIYGLIFMDGKCVFNVPLWGSLSVIAVCLLAATPGCFLIQPVATCLLNIQISVALFILALIIVCLTPQAKTDKVIAEFDPTPQEKITCSCEWAIDINYEEHTIIKTKTFLYTGFYEDAVQKQEAAVSLWNTQNPKTPAISSELKVYYMSKENAKANHWPEEISLTH
jgi:hypothetical protein